ncbi:beta-glucuronidase, partial [Enterocloster sp.]|uniref:beta-glucuronidase n=1 Tax=Enterocloster sp. TaxID=2719315 RepID=UPI00388F4918
MLYPKMTESRMVFDLNGVWDFCLMDGEAKGEIVPMPVPSSYNDIYTGRGFADHVGNLYYRRKFTVSSRMLEKRLFLRFGSVTHKAEVWLNGTCLGKHSGGFLPFSFEITETAIAGENELEVIVNNIVDETTLPAGRMVHQKFPGLPEEIHNLPNFDFYNYSGIMRPVCLYTAPGSYIEDISIYGKMDGSFYWDVKANGEGTVSVRLLDAAGNEVAAGEGFKGTGQIDQVQLWEPGHPVLYSLEVTLTGSDGEKDTYTEVFGFREVSIRDCRIHLNGKPVYLKGFGKHEDSPVHGRGFDMAYNVKDIGLLKWIGANSFRTSHYPYCEEMLQLCDREGILVIDEAPAVGLNAGFTATGLLGGNPNGTWKLFKTAEHHRQVLRDMVQRDKNHPCVIIWSVANEPASQEDGAKEYFEPLLNLVRELDEQKRPATLVTYEGSNPVSCKVAEICDLLIINRYRGWYDTEGNLRGAAALLKDELEGFHKRCPDKPIMLGEYGADTIAGFHDINARIFSEEYQVDFLRAYGEVFDSLPYITGEHVWNFADFAT